MHSQKHQHTQPTRNIEYMGTEDCKANDFPYDFQTKMAFTPNSFSSEEPSVDYLIFTGGKLTIFAPCSVHYYV